MVSNDYSTKSKVSNTAEGSVLYEVKLAMNQNEIIYTSSF